MIQACLCAHLCAAYKANQGVALLSTATCFLCPCMYQGWELAMIFYMRVTSGPSFPVARFPFPRPTDLSAQTIAAATVRYEMARPTPAAMAAVAGSSRWMLGSNPTLRLSIMAQKQMRFRHWAANTLEESRISPNSVFTTFCNSWSYVCAGDSWVGVAMS